MGKFFGVLTFQIFYLGTPDIPDIFGKQKTLRQSLRIQKNKSTPWDSRGCSK